jgi:zinc/manganese transport system substrate-binding protein
MHIRILLLASLLGALLLTACGGSDGGGSSTEVKAATLASGEKLHVVATTVQVTALAREVGGDRIELKGIVPAGADAHEFEPIASDLAAIEQAHLILRNGIGLDDWLDDSLKAAKYASSAVVTRGVKIRQIEEDGKKVEDAHVWHNVDNAKLMTDNVASALAKADPANKEYYEARRLSYGAKLDTTKQRVQATIDEIPADSRKLVTNHDSLHYFADAFGLTVVGAVIPSVSTDAEPSAKDASALLETIRKQRVKAIFAESSVNPALARSLARDANVKVIDDLYGDSLGKPGSGADTIDGMLLANARKIADGLK